MDATTDEEAATLLTVLERAGQVVAGRCAQEGIGISARLT